MNDKKVTLIISDTHIGAGDKNDDHVYDQQQLESFIGAMNDSPEGKKGEIELFINGDFLEFAQVLPEAYTLRSSKAWCSEKESLLKLEEIIKGHSNIFEALADFQINGNRVTIAAGNHDVDLYWGEVQKRIQKVAGAVNFELKKVICERYDKRLLIGHGHMYDVANRFNDWESPFVREDDNLGIAGAGVEERLEMCPGTLFMVKFVNWLEDQYPFSDNMIPLWKLAILLLKEKKKSFVAAAWTLFKLLGKNPLVTLSADKTESIMPDIGMLIRNKSAQDPAFLRRMEALHMKATGKFDDPSNWNKKEVEDKARDFMLDLLVNLPLDEWETEFDALGGASTLSINGNEKTLSIVRAAAAKDKIELSETAQKLFAGSNAEVVVFGHTHQPDEWRGNSGKWDGGYFNPGSWTRYVDVRNMANLTLEDLKDESDFPYALNYIRVEKSASNNLRADTRNFAKQDGKRFKV